MTFAPAATNRHWMVRTIVTGKTERGFTFMELLVVLALIALLASMIAPVLTGSIARAREAALKENLQVMRKSIDDYYGDRSEYPPDLDTLVQKRYLRRVPVDPLTERADSWRLVKAEHERGGVMDVHSGSDEQSGEGGYYRDW